MLIKETRLCPNCFTEVKEEVQQCTKCKFKLDYKPKNVFALPPMTIVADRYLIGRVLGSGGFGITYLAKDLLTDEKCAIKEYLPFNWVHRPKNQMEVIPNSDQKKLLFEHGKHRFINEAKILLKFRSEPDIVNVKNYFASNNTAYLSMEFLDGANFRQIINQMGGKAPIKIAQSVFISTANALKKLHAEHVLHRDISMENIFILRSGAVKLIDFGSAKQIVEGTDQTVTIYLKPGLAPIEQYSSKGSFGPWTDIYALASTFYQVFTGEAVPVSTDRLKNDNLTPIGELFPELGPNWCHVIDKSLQIYPEDRYQNIDELLADLPVKVITKQDYTVVPVVEENIQKKEPPVRILTSRAYLFVERTSYRQFLNNKIYLDDNRSYTIGRSSRSSDLVVDIDECVSRQHCIVVYVPHDGCFYVKDMSSNGTFTEKNRRISRTQFEKIDPHTAIYLGSSNTVLRLELEQI